MNLIGAWYLLGLLTGVPLYWSLPGRWRHAAAGAVGLLWLSILAPASALFCLGLAAGARALVRAQCSLQAAQGAALFAFGLLLGFREILSKGAQGAPWVPWLGAGIFTLRAIHHLLSATRDRQPPASWAALLGYLFFPPSLLVGPFQRFADFEREIRRCRFDTQQLSAGLERLLFGYAKVVLLASYVLDEKAANALGALPTGSAKAYLECLHYGLTLYARFSGYCDIAIGTGLLLGIRLPENFHHPFLARNIGDFWQRWNASVSNWCREQVSHPLYARTRSAVVAAMASMMVLGLWHEVSSRYMVWALYHGAGIALWQRWRALRGTLAPSSAWLAMTEAGLARLLTFNFVVIGFAFTRSPDLGAAWRTLLTLLGG